MISIERDHTDDTHRNNSDEDLKYLQRDDLIDDTMQQHSIDIHVTNAACHGTQRTSTYIARTRTEQSS